MRRAIQMLQSLHQLHGGELQPGAVLDISGALPPDRLDSVFEVCKRNDFDAMQAFVDDVLADGYPVSQLVAQMLDWLLSPKGKQFTSAQASKIAVQLAEVDKQLIDGADDYMQLTNLLAHTMRTLKA